MALEGMRISHYQILRLIGTGGMGEVYLAQDMRIARQVAIKVVRNEILAYPHAEEMKQMLRLFEREMQAIAVLDHPHILPLYDFGEEQLAQGALTYMVMPFRPEGSLSQWLDRFYHDRLLSPHDLLFLLQQAANALQYAHNARIMHLDVKPSNFLIRQQEQAPDHHPYLFLTDFGISRFHTSTATASQSIRGTPLSMAPEQWTSAPVPATDQYALAIMAYQSLTGASPFQGNMQQVMYQHLQVSPKAPSEHNAHLPQAVDDVLLRALAKRPEDRFASITHFVDALALAWQHSSMLPEHTADPEALILTELIPSNVETVSPLPLTVRVPTHPAFPVAEKQPAQQGNSQISSSSDGELSSRSAQVFTAMLTPVPPASHRNRRHPLVPVVIGACLLLAFVSLGAWAYLAHAFVLVPVSSPTVLSPSAPAHTPLPTPTNTSVPITPTLPVYPQLKAFYSGTATGYANATITFSLQSEDQQGNVAMQTTFERTDNQASAIYTCQGQVSQDDHLTLACVGAISTFHLSIHGTIFADGHMAGTEEATDTNDPTYDHLYTWSVS